MQQDGSLGLQRQEAFKLRKPSGDLDEQLKKEISMEPPHAYYSSNSSVMIIHSENIASQVEQSIVKNLIGDQGNEDKGNQEEEKQTWKVDPKYFQPILLLSLDKQLLVGHSSSNSDPTARDNSGKKEPANNTPAKDYYPRTSPLGKEERKTSDQPQLFYDTIIDKNHIDDGENANSKQDNGGNLRILASISNETKKSNPNSNQFQDNLVFQDENNKFTPSATDKNNQTNFCSPAKAQSKNDGQDTQQPVFDAKRKDFFLNINQTEQGKGELSPTELLVPPEIRKESSSSAPNQDLFDEMCDTPIKDLQVLGSIEIMLICLLTQFGQSQLAEELYFKFQRQILRIDETSKLFEIDLYEFIWQQLKSEIFINEIILFGLRQREFIPLLNLFLVVFQVRLNVIRNQILSSMVKSSLNSLEIVLGNFKKRIPLNEKKRRLGIKKITLAMNKLQVFYQKKGSIENEHDLLIFVINEGLHQVSQELLGFFVYNKFIPPELFLTKKVIKFSLIQINIPIFRRAFVFRRKWVKNVFLTEKFFLHICSLIRCDETFAEGLYFMKKISQKKQRSSAPLWYTENVIELFEECAKKQIEYHMLQVYTLSPIVSSLIISKMLYKLSLNKNPLQVQLNRLSDFYKNLAIEFRDQISDERQMKMQLFKIIFPSDKSLVQICKTPTIYTYFNEFLQHDLILKLLQSKFISSYHFDTNLFANSTSFSYLSGTQKVQMPYLHYNQKFEKINLPSPTLQSPMNQPSQPLLIFNFKDTSPKNESKPEVQYFEHISPQPVPRIPSKFKTQLDPDSIKPDEITGITGSPMNLVKQYRAAIKKKKTMLFKNDIPSVKYPNQQKIQGQIKLKKEEKENTTNAESGKNKPGAHATGRGFNIFKEISPISLSFVMKSNHFHSLHIYKKSLHVRNQLETLLYVAVFCYSIVQFFKILTISNFMSNTDSDMIDIFLNTPSYSLYQEIITAGLTYTPDFSIGEIAQYNEVNMELFCKYYITIMTNNITKYVTLWSEQCQEFSYQNSKIQTATDDFRSALYMIYLIPTGLALRLLHARLTHRKVHLGIEECMDLMMVILFILDWVVYYEVQQFFKWDSYPTSVSELKPTSVSMGQEMQYRLKEYSYILTILLFILFCKFFQFLSRSEKLGVFMKILGLALKQMVSFMFIFMLNIFAFGSLFYLLSSYRLSLYSTFLGSLRSLIATSLGTFDFNDMNDTESIIQVIFLYSSNVIMINLLIAILTKTYSDITKRSSVEYALIMYENYRVKKLDKAYSVLIAFPPPLTGLSVIFMPLLIIKRFDLNALSMKFGYSLILAAFFVVFFVVNILIVPFTWFKMIFSLARYQIQSISLNKMLLQRSKSGLLAANKARKESSQQSSSFGASPNQKSNNPEKKYLKQQQSETKNQAASEPDTPLNLLANKLPILSNLTKQGSHVSTLLAERISSTSKSYIWFMISAWSILIFKLLSWILFGIPFLLYHSIVTDSILFLKSSFAKVENKYKFDYGKLNSPTPYRIYYLLKLKSNLIDKSYRSESIVTNFHLLQGYFKFKYFIKEATIEAKKSSSKIHNYFMKLLKISTQRKKRAMDFAKIYQEEYDKSAEKRNDIIQNGHTDEIFLAVMRMKQINYSTEFWDKNKVTSKRQASFYNLAINPSIKHTNVVQKSLIRKLQSQTQNYSEIRQVIQRQTSTMNLPQAGSFNSLSQKNSRLPSARQQPQRSHLQTLYEQTDAE